MKRIRKYNFTILIALILVGCIALSGCGNKEVTNNSSQTAEKIESDSTQGDDVTNTGEEAPEVELVGGKKPNYSKGNWKPINEDDFEYDLKVTTFNVGHFYYGTNNLDVYGAQVNVHPGITPERIMGAYDAWMNLMPEMDSDIYGMQEWDEIFLVDSKKNLEIKAADAFAGTFKTLKNQTWTTWSGNVTVGNALAVSKDSKYTLTDVTFGYLSEKDSEVRRGYLKGYITVSGKKVAVYSVHLEPRDEKEWARKDSMRELAKLMKQDEYAIVMGDMNCENIAKYMKGQGFNVANMGEFGNFGTYLYRETYIDNIITTPNISIQAVTCNPNLRGGSDHYPLTAYLKIMDGSNIKDNTQTGADGFIDGWYKP